MSEQQQLHQTNLFPTQTIGRTPEACMVPMFYQTPANSRLDGVNFPSNVAHMHNPYFPVYPVRGPDPLLYRHLPQPAMLCAYAPTIPDTQMHSHLPNSTQDYGHVMTQQSYHQFPFPQVLQSAQTQPPTTSSMHRQIPVSAATVPSVKLSKPREKCPLTVKHPDTGVIVDLGSASNEVPVEESNEPTVTSETKTQDLASPTAPLDMHDSKITSSEPIQPYDGSSLMTDCSVTVPEFESTEELATLLIPSDKIAPSAEQLSNKFSSAPAVDQTRLDVESTEDESCTETDESDSDDTLFRRRYSRDFLLSLKEAPAAILSLPHLAVITNPANQWKYRRNPHRAPQRIIRLPTGITVKTVEGAFVPTSLRKKDGTAENDKPKALSRELNVILNRVSDGNLAETVTDIRRLELSSSDDLQLLAKLVFQKGIRQPKYSKVFATLCKELKGFEVPGSESFESLILRQVQDLFNTPLDTLISDLNVAIDAKIASAKDEAVKRILDEDRETNVLKKKEAYDGNMTLLSELFLCRLVPLKTMRDCLNKLKDSAAPEALRSMLIILQICGSELEIQAKNILDTCFSRLNGHIKSNKLPTHQVFKIQELCDLRERGWKEMTYNQDLPAQPNVISRRPTEEKLRWQYLQPVPDSKRRSVQSVNPVTPSSLAVTQQPQDARKLGPTRANWVQGSGQLKPSDDNQLQSPKTTTHPPISGRSREASPLVPPGPQGVWAQRKASGPAAALENSKPIENYEIVLTKCQRMARSTVELLLSREDNVLDSVEECPAEHRSALLHLVFETLMDRSVEERKAAGELCLRLLNKKLITPADVASACRAYFSTLDDGWTAEYVFGWKYLAEIFQHFIQNGPDHFQLLTSILRPLHSGGRGANVLAHCLRMSAARLGPDVVSFKFQSMRLDWTQLGISPGDVLSFINEHSISFTIDPNPLAETLKELRDLAQLKSTTLDQLNKLFKQLPHSDLPYGFIRQCTIALVNRHRDLPRQSIDQRVIALGILVDHNPERESQVLHALDECSKTVPVEQWRKSLLDNKVISTEAFKSWGNSNVVSKGSIDKNFSMPE